METPNSLVVGIPGRGREFLVERIEIEAALVECVQHPIANALGEQRILQRTRKGTVESTQQLRDKLAARIHVYDRGAKREGLIQVVIPVRPATRQFVQRAAVRLL
jgi:adenylate kinase